MGIDDLNFEGSFSHQQQQHQAPAPSLLLGGGGLDVLDFTNVPPPPAGAAAGTASKVEQDILKLTELYNRPSQPSAFSVSNRVHPIPGNLDFLNYSWTSATSPVKGAPPPGPSSPTLSNCFGSPNNSFLVASSPRPNNNATTAKTAVGGGISSKPQHSSLSGLDAFSLVQTLQSNTRSVTRHVTDLL